jgi:hypothetical protein
MDLQATSAPWDAVPGETLVEIEGRTLPVEFLPVETNPLWIGDAAEAIPLFHWICRLGGTDPIEFHHTQSWPDFDAATAVGCLIADADDVRAAGSFPDWSRLCGHDPDSAASDLSSRLARSYEAMLGYVRQVDALRTAGEDVRSYPMTAA